MQLKGATLALCLAFLSAAPASSPEACDATGTCDATKGSAMLQVRGADTSDMKATKVKDHEGFASQPVGLVGVESRRSCISQFLRTANHKAVAKTSPECPGVAQPGMVCKNHGVDGKCALPKTAADIEYVGDDPKNFMICDIGQYESCSAEKVDQPCTVLGGLKGTCKQTGQTGMDFAPFPIKIFECTGLSGEELKPEPEPESKPNSLKSSATKESKELDVVSSAGFSVGQDIVIDAGTAIEESNKIVGFGTLLLATPLQYDHGTGAVITPASSVGQGGTASLDAAGFKAVTSLCCPQETETFFNRLLDKEGYTVCSTPHVQGLMHWFSCVPDMDFQYMLDVIANGNPCKYWSPKGTDCPVLSPQCQGEWCR